jgi:predicted metallopeptidase
MLTAITADRQAPFFTGLFAIPILDALVSLGIMHFHYERAPDVSELLSNIIDKLGFTHVPRNRVYCYRSYGSKARNVVARVHSLPRIWQQALSEPAYYAVEVLAEQYDRLSLEEKEKTLIHELLHIPKSFAGGFRHHKDWVTRRRIESLYLAMKNSSQE